MVVFAARESHGRGAMPSLQVVNVAEHPHGHIHEQFASQWQIDQANFAVKARLAVRQFRWLKQK